MAEYNNTNRNGSTGNPGGQNRDYGRGYTSGYGSHYSSSGKYTVGSNDGTPHYSSPNRSSSPKKNSSTSEWVPWALIALLMFNGAWFIALPWLLIKLFGSDKKKTETKAPPLKQQQTAEQPVRTSPSVKERAKEISIASLTKTPGDGKLSRILLAAGGILAGIAGISIAYDPLAYGIYGAGDVFTLLSAAAITAGGAAMVFSSVSAGRAQKRFGKYTAVIGEARAVELAALSVKLGIPEKTVKKDIQRMIDKGMFGKSAYINDELGYLFVDSAADDALRAARADAMERAEQEHAGEMPGLYTAILAEIRDVNKRIPDPDMTRKITDIEKTTAQIFAAVQREPKKARKIDRFLNYYLPTVQKLLEAYAHYETMAANGVPAENVRENMENIEHAIDSVSGGFHNLLNSLYEEDVVDVKSDIDVLNQMMNADGHMGSSDFNVSGTPAQEKNDGRIEFVFPQHAADEVCEPEYEKV